MTINYKSIISKRAAVGYSRVSTTRQAELGSSLLDQDQAIRDFCQQRGLLLLRIYGEPTTGMVEDEAHLDEDLQAAIDEAAREEAVLVVAETSRLGRSHAVFSYLNRSAVLVASVRDGGLLPSEELGRKLEQAAQEGRQIRLNVCDGLAAAKRRGTKLGNRTNLEHARVRAAIARRSNADALTEAIEEMLRPHEILGRTRAAHAAQILNSKGLRTARGNLWTKQNIRRHLSKARGLRIEWQ